MYGFCHVCNIKYLVLARDLERSICKLQVQRLDDMV